MKILFVTHDLRYAGQIGIDYLAGVARDKGHQRFFCTLERERFCDLDLQTAVQVHKPDVVAYSMISTGFQRLVDCHAKAKKYHNFVSILGGPQATFTLETFPQSGVDAYCVGEGEGAFADFLDAVEQDKPYAQIANLITVSGSQPVRRLAPNLDALPFPDRDLILGSTLLSGEPKKSFMATRGCNWNCHYCANNHYHTLYKGKGPWVRRLSVDRLLEEVVYVQHRYPLKFVKFGDDCFSIAADKWMEEFANKYPKTIGVPFNCYLRIDNMNTDLLYLLKKAGCWSVHLSVDSLSKHVREDILGRRMPKTNEELGAAIEKLDRFGIKSWVNYMLTAPDSTLQDDLDTIQFSRDHKVSYPHFSTTSPIKNTRLYDMSVERQLIPLGFEEDVEGRCDRSPYSCFSDADKDIRLNILLLGAIVAKLPAPLYQLGKWIILHTKPNRFYEWLREQYLTYNYHRIIFRL